MRPSLFIGRVIPAAILTFLAGAASAQPLPHTSLNKSAGRAFSIGPAPARVARPAGTCAPDGLCLVVTLALDDGNPSQCGTSTDLAVNIGDSVNICYTVTNHSATTLNYQTLADDHVGTVFANDNVAIAPGASYQYNRTILASTNPSGDTSRHISSSAAGRISSTTSTPTRPSRSVKRRKRPTSSRRNTVGFSSGH